MKSGFIEVDLHGMNCYQAKVCIDSKIRSADRSVYYIRVIHGYRGGTDLKNMVKDEYSFGRNSKVLRVKQGGNPGITDLVLREL